MLQITYVNDFQHSYWKELQNTEIDKNIHLCSSDITNMYIKIPQTELPKIIQQVLKNSNINYDTFITDIQNNTHNPRIKLFSI
jgi:hypothetical protein